MSNPKKRSAGKLYGGATLLIIGIIMIAWALGWISMIPGIGATVLSASKLQPAGMMITSSIKNYPFLSEVAPQGTYEWEVGVVNTGSLPWTDSWFCVRLLKKTSQAVLVSHPEYGGAQYYVGSCSSGIDNIGCRENIEQASPTGWNMRYKGIITGNNWWDISDASMNDQVFCPSMGGLSPGQSITWNLRMTVPNGILQGSFPVIATSGANVQNYGKIIGSRIDLLTIGTIDGNFTFLGIGSVLSLLGIVAMGLSGKP